MTYTPADAPTSTSTVTTVSVSTQTTSTTKTVVPLTNVADVSGGKYHAAAYFSDGSVQAWGSNSSGQLGIASQSDIGTPVVSSNVALPVTGFPGTAAIAEIWAGVNHTVARAADGSIWTWGGDENGQLGNGSIVNYPFPIQISGFDGSAFLLSDVSTTPVAATTATVPTSACLAATSSDADRIFNWAEATYGSSAKIVSNRLFYPPAVSVDNSEYRYRYYSGTNAYLAFKAETNSYPVAGVMTPYSEGIIYYYAPSSQWREVISLGKSCIYLKMAKEAGY
jgi:hypothetical protein